MASDVAGATTTYTFGFTTALAIPSGGKLCIVLPTEVTADTSTISCTYTGALSGAAACSFDTVTRCIEAVHTAAAGEFTVAVSNLGNPSTAGTYSF